jgi:hypothetical protein
MDCLGWSEAPIEMGKLIPKAVSTDASWKVVYRIGAVAAFIAVVLFRRNLSAELMILADLGVIGFAPANAPVTAMGWFSLLEKSPLVGLCLLNLFDLVNFFLVGLLFLAMYGALRKTKRNIMLLATALFFAGFAVCLVFNRSLVMLSLSRQYAAAAAEDRRSMLLASAQAALSIDDVGFYLNLFLLKVAGLIASIGMLRTEVFSRATAYCGLVANGFALCIFFTLTFASTLSAIPIAVAAPFRLAWYVLIALRLFRLAAVPSAREHP